MRKLKSLIAIAGLLAMPLLATSVSAADCTISNTGPGSTNTCTDTSTYTCTVTNNNVVIFGSNNQQVATSGSANNSGNTGSGGATSGSATNSNGTTFNYTVTNGACAVTTVTTPTPEPEKPVGGQGAAGETPAVVKKPTVLARTSGETIVPAVVAIVALLAAAVAGLRAYSVVRSR